MDHCDVFIIEDDVQLEDQGFQNRNRVKTFEGVKWLTVPIEHIGKPQAINEVKIGNSAEPKWAERHWLTLKYNYSKALFWEDYKGFFEETYSQRWEKLFDLNMHLIRGLMKFLRIEKPLVMASSLGVSGKKSDLVLAQCKAVGADTLLAGTGAHEYLERALESFKREGIKVIFQNFKHPVYSQLHGAFVPNLSAVDYLFCAAGKYWSAADTKVQEQRV
jgi:hypothetical protein